MQYHIFNDDWLLDKLYKLDTPCYVYDSKLLEDNLANLNLQIRNCLDYQAVVHYALKANDNQELFTIIKKHNLGVDCVSGGEVEYARRAGFSASDIVFAGVGKTDNEIIQALKQKIYCFNVESQQELEVINQLAAQEGLIASIMLRVNPDIDAKTHKSISTGKYDNKFGMPFSQIIDIVNNLRNYLNIKLIGLHYHIGSQICDLSVYKELALVVSKHYQKLESYGVILSDLNLGGGLGVNYSEPEINPLSNFADYFSILNKNLTINKNIILHFELGRSIVAQCGVLLSSVLYTKQTSHTKFVILDAGMNDLMRPALYNASHKIKVLKQSDIYDYYDVVGPICESTDIFAKQVKLASPVRGDKVVIYTTGAYGYVLANTYNKRDKIREYVY